MRTDERPEWLQVISTGVCGGYNWQLLLDGKTHAVLKRPGMNSYVDRCTGVTYSPVDYVLVRKRNKRYWGADINVIWTGRLTKEGRKKVEDALKEADKK